MTKHIFTLTLILSAFLSFGQRLNTPTLSPFSKISQQIGLTEIGLEYARPSARGRVIFGNLVPFDQVWRTGANASTKIILSEPAQIGGKDINAGTYALYTIPGVNKWTIIIHANTKLRSLAGGVYQQEKDVFRFEVEPRKAENYVETFTLQFTDLRTNSLNLQLSWENTRIDIPILVEVDEKIASQMAEFLKSPETIPHRTYFEAAQYYLHNDRDKAKAFEWINAALRKSPENPRYGLLKAKIYAKSGHDMAAMDTVTEAYKWAVKSDNANYIEQTVLFRKTLMKKN